MFRLCANKTHFCIINAPHAWVSCVLFVFRGVGGLWDLWQIYSDEFITCSGSLHPSLLFFLPSPPCLCRLDSSQPFAGFKDTEILIELLCNSTSRCINRQLDINHSAFVFLHVCVCFFLSVVKSLSIDPVRSSCDVALRPWTSFLLTHTFLHAGVVDHATCFPQFFSFISFDILPSNMTSTFTMDVLLHLL